MPFFAVRYTYSSEPDNRAVRDGLRPEHRAYLAGLGDALAVLGPADWDGVDGALLILELPDLSAVTAVLAHDPFMTSGAVVTHTVSPWSPVLGRWAGV